MRQLRCATPQERWHDDAPYLGVSDATDTRGMRLSRMPGPPMPAPVQSAVYTANTVSLMVPVAPVLVNGLLPTCDSSRHGHAPQNQYATVRNGTDSVAELRHQAVAIKGETVLNTDGRRRALARPNQLSIIYAVSSLQCSSIRLCTNLNGVHGVHGRCEGQTRVHTTSQRAWACGTRDSIIRSYHQWFITHTDVVPAELEWPASTTQ